MRALQCCGMIYGNNNCQESEHPREREGCSSNRTPAGWFETSQQAWYPMASSSAKPCPKRSTVPRVLLLNGRRNDLFNLQLCVTPSKATSVSELNNPITGMLINHHAHAGLKAQQACDPIASSSHKNQPTKKHTSTRTTLFRIWQYRACNQWAYLYVGRVVSYQDGRVGDVSTLFNHGNHSRDDRVLQCTLHAPPSYLALKRLPTKQATNK
jgi:hypothetical protein